MSLLDQIKGEMSSFEEKLTEIIPGYSGYKQKEMRREADKLLRETLVNRMRTIKRELDALQQDLISAVKFDLLDEVGSTITQLQTFIDRVRTASYGYSGLFDAVRVKEDDLDRLYQFDARLLEYAERMEQAVGRAREEIEGDVKPFILLMRDIIREANATFDERTDVIRGSSEAPSL